MSARRTMVAVLLGLAVQAAAQEPGKAPRESASTSLAGKKVKVTYGRPSLGGRTLPDLFSALGADRVWRPGADQVTAFETEGDLLVSGQKVPAGKYTLYVHAPETGDWSLLVNGDQGVPLRELFPEAPPEMGDQIWGPLGTYDKIKAKEIVRAPMKRGAAPKRPAEQLSITLAPEKAGASALVLAWADQVWSAELKPAK
jgi:DUF2911 family protein